MFVDNDWGRKISELYHVVGRKSGTSIAAEIDGFIVCRRAVRLLVNSRALEMELLGNCRADDTFN